MRNTIVRCLCIVFLGLLAMPGAADAQTAAYTNAPANLRAGPAEDYPLVAQIPEGTMVSVIGCISDYTWCDVALPGVRGWLYAGLLDYPYQGGAAPLLDYGAEIGFPVVVFAIGPYWDRYYRNRPWFHDRDRFTRRAEPRIGPGGMPPGRGHPQQNEPPPAAVMPGAGGRPGERGGHEGGHDARPSATRGGWTGGIRTPAPAPMPMPAPMPAPMPQGGGNMRAPAPSATMHAPPPAPAAPMHAPAPSMQAPAPAVAMPPQGHQDGGGGGGQRGSFGGRQGGGGGGGGHGGDFRHD
ncbi:SH3 domain-containing protein [Burkholderia stagnalis]|uniref:SH3 domain-containing protein n=1 Tax=Burkholderia stagnalis TaxID=1503054 RepID=UPI0007552D0A|nr:SH3 domain-containing protein [Burkholderia stagnalis]KVO58553.1 peptide-binding protein [Burkholderia stagnalis]KVP10669.1 peptide-binding protein [Burkholderia stagnalis]KVW98297.1 peptide-binding protein [Burkholderia stagnalis]KWH83969.1 peptide-binding protein [Burkholderia stagnalis]